MAEQKYNEHKFIAQVRQLLIDEGLEPETASYADVSSGASTMLRGMGIRSVLDVTDVIDRSWPSKREETDSPW